MVRLKVEVDVQQMVKTLAEKARAYEQHHRYRELQHSEIRTDAPPQNSGRATRTLRQTLAQLAEGEPQNRCEREDDCGKDRDDRSKRKNMRVQPETTQIGHMQHNHILRDQTK